MLKREELIKTEEFWYETLQNDIFRMVSDYLRKEGINQSQLADKLGVTKGYISQIMNGNFNYTLKKLIELSLALKTAPVIDFKDIDQFIKEDISKRFEMRYDPFYTFDFKKSNNEFISGTSGISIIKNSKSDYFELAKIA
jgi:transcriptional regulator with XRE-family HTH domain